MRVNLFKQKISQEICEDSTCSYKLFHNLHEHIGSFHSNKNGNWLDQLVKFKKKFATIEPIIILVKI